MPLNRFIALIGCLLFAAALTPGGVAAADEAKGNDLLHQIDNAFAGVFEKVAPAVVIIEAEKKAGSEDKEKEEALDFFFRNRPNGGDDSDHGQGGRRGLKLPAPTARSEGSGFIIRPDGYILTNFHVIEEADKIEVKLKDGRHFPGKVVGSDDKTDIAVVKIEARDLPVAELLDSDTVRVGQLCFAIGVPYNLDYSFSGGYVSAKGRSNLTSSATKPMYEDYIQTDAFINPGNSGGPLFDVDGRVMGMNTLINGIGRGLAFAVPSNMLKNIGGELIASGKVIRAWLGIRIETLGDNPALSEHIHGIDKGVVVDTIEPDAPAYKSDLRPADVITQVDGVAVANARDLQKEVLKKKVGQSVELAVWRNGKSISIPVTAGELPSDFTKVANTAPGKSLPEAKTETFGLQFQDVPKIPGEKARGKMTLPTGALVTDVEAESPADEAGIQPGDLITEVNEKPVANAAAVRAALRSGDAGRGILLFIERKGQKTYAVIKSS